MHSTIRRLSGAWASSPVLSEPPPLQSLKHRHRYHHCHEKNYDTLPLGGNRPIASATTAVDRRTVLSDREVAKKEERKERWRRSRSRERVSSESKSRTSTSSLGAESKSSRSSKSHRRKPQDKPVTGSASDRRENNASDNKRSSAVAAGVPIAPAMESPGSVSSIDSTFSTTSSSPATGGVAISKGRKRQETNGREPNTLFITTTPPTPSPLEQARRRNTRPASLVAPSATSPPYPATPPVSDRNMESNSGGYIAYHQHPMPSQRRPSSPSGLGIHDIHPALRPGSPRPRANTTPSTASAPPAFPSRVANAAAVEIGSSDSIPQRKTSRKEDPYLMLERFDTVLVVDDSASMSAHWNATRDALESVATVALKHDNDGVDIHFMNHPENDAWNVKSAVHVRRLFSQVEPAGCTPTGQCLDEILREYIDRYAASKAPASPCSSPPSPLFSNGAKPSTVKPLNILVLTDGEPTDDPESVIVWAARKLEQLNAPLHQVGIQFLQIGDEEGAREALEELDDALEGVYGIRDMVDTTRYVQEGEEINGNLLLKALLGGINRRLDRRRL